MFKFEFMRTAFIVGSLLALVIPLIGNLVVYKRMSMVGDALSHISLSGIALGLILNINPILGAILLSLLSALGIEWIQKKFGQFTELAISIVMSLGIGLSAILLSFVEQPGAFNTFLFGSIVTISGTDAILAAILVFVILAVSIFMYRDFFFVAFDEVSAKLAGIRVSRTNTIFMILTAITVSIASRIVGALIVSSLLVIPTASAMQIGKSYKSTMLFGILYSLASVWVGLSASYYLNLAPGGTIVLTSILLLLLTLVIRNILNIKTR